MITFNFFSVKIRVNSGDSFFIRGFREGSRKDETRIARILTNKSTQFIREDSLDSCQFVFLFNALLKGIDFGIGVAPVTSAAR